MKTARVCAKAAIAASKARASGKKPVYKAPNPPAITHDRGVQMGYKDMANHVSGPKHTRHLLEKRLAKGNQGDAASSHFYTGYVRGVRKAGEDYLNHIDKVTGGRRTRTTRRINHALDKI